MPVWSATSGYAGVAGWQVVEAPQVLSAFCCPLGQQVAQGVLGSLLEHGFLAARWGGVVGSLRLVSCRPSGLCLLKAAASFGRPLIREAASCSWTLFAVCSSYFYA